MPDPDPNEFVYIKHKDIDGIGGPVTRASVEDPTGHGSRGWTIVKPDAVPVGADVPPLPVAPAAVTSTTPTPKGS